MLPKKPQETKETIKAWLASQPEGPPWTADDPDPLIRKAVQHGFTMAQPTTSTPLPVRLEATVPATPAVCA